MANTNFEAATAQVAANITMAVVDEVLEAIAWSDRLDVNRDVFGLWAEGEVDNRPVSGSIQFEFDGDRVTVVLTARNGVRVRINGIPKIGIA